MNYYVPMGFEWILFVPDHCTIIKRIQEQYYLFPPAYYISWGSGDQADTLTRAYIRRQTSVGGQSVIDGSNRVVQWPNGTLRGWRPIHWEIFRMKDFGKTIYIVCTLSLDREMKSEVKFCKKLIRKIFNCVEMMKNIGLIFIKNNYQESMPSSNLNWILYLPQLLR